MNNKPRSIKKLLILLPHVKDITLPKHKKKGTIILLNEYTNRKYYIYKSGFAKAVNASNHSQTDFINAWASETRWQTCYPFSKGELISNLYDYIKYYDSFPRMAIWDYNVERKGEEEKIWSSIRNCWIKRSESYYE